MSRLKVLESVCDRCTTEVRVPFPERRRGEGLVLPEGWLHVSGETATAVVFEMDLCRDCKRAVMEAAGAAVRY